MNKTTRESLPRHLIVVEKASDWKSDYPAYPVVTAREYLSSPDYARRGVKVLNLCRSFGYQTTGYYCSLLAQARRHRMLPSVRTLSDLMRKSLYQLEAEDLHERLQKAMKKVSEDKLELWLFFGRLDEGAPAHLAELAREIFEAFSCPILRIELRKDGGWKIFSVRAGSLTQLKAGQRTRFINALESFISKPWRNRKSRGSSRYDLAVLFNPDDPLPPSDLRALKHLERVGKTMGFYLEIIGKKDYARIAEFDGLFIRETTRINHHTYRFARKAESEGVVVIDDPESILLCTNKVYLAELLRANRLPAPRTVVLQEGMLQQAEALGYPVVLKIPDGSFSRGVYKAANRRELEEITTKLFRESDLILAQEYLYTEYDWRIGVLNRKPLFACQYFMSKNHWQIVDHKKGGSFSEGGYRTLPIEEAPEAVVKTAVAAAGLIGDSFYGVDIKQNGNKVYVIEINDNPNLEAGVEDAHLKDALYRAILEEFARRIDAKRAS
ncbi:MAG: RimK family protein [Gammaproteobacteria bacterium]|nr:RimK family protein [Gammaproteobacteria bacterium]